MSEALTAAVWHMTCTWEQKIFLLALADEAVHPDDFAAVFFDESRFTNLAAKCSLSEPRARRIFEELRANALIDDGPEPSWVRILTGKDGP